MSHRHFCYIFSATFLRFVFERAPVKEDVKEFARNSQNRFQFGFFSFSFFTSITLTVLHSQKCFARESRIPFNIVTAVPTHIIMIAQKVTQSTTRFFAYDRQFPEKICVHHHSLNINSAQCVNHRRIIKNANKKKMFA